MIALGIVIATVVAWIIGGVYYGAMPSDGASGSAPQRPMAMQLLVELLRSLAVATLVAGLLVISDLTGPVAGVLAGLALWVLPVVLLAGSVFHEGVPIRRAALHAGDWLLKLVAMGAVVGLFR